MPSLWQAGPVDVSRVRTQPRRFYDGGLPSSAEVPGAPPDPGADPRIVLERHARDGLETFAMLRRLAYVDRHLGELLVPADPAAFRTDLTSVPALFTWLVPRTGAHLPAALLHDGLVAGGPDEPVSYVSTDGHVVDRVTADRVFRDAMADTGTGVVRRWIVWTAVTAATLVLGRGVPWGPARTWRYRAVVGLTVAVVLLLGYGATADLFDVAWPGAVDVWWMPEGPWWRELAGGAAGALLVPVPLGLLWGRFAVAGVLAGVLLAALLHVTAALLVVVGAYQLLERVVALADRGRRRLPQRSE